MTNASAQTSKTNTLDKRDHTTRLIHYRLDDAFEDIWCPIRTDKGSSTHTNYCWRGVCAAFRFISEDKGYCKLIDREGVCK